MRIFLSHYSGEVSIAEDIAEHLKKVFSNESLEVFVASSWESVAPGDAWEDKLVTALEEADALVVLMSVDALGRSWLNFELGVAWARKTRIVIFCHKGLSLSGLPRPYSSLQAVDINGMKQEEMLNTVAEAIASALNVRLPSETPATATTEVEQATAGSFQSTYRAWSLRPGGHIGETLRGRFLVGTVSQSRPDRARAADLEPQDTLYIRLFIGTSPEGRYVQVLVSGDIAGFFETVEPDSVLIEATLRLAAVFEEGDSSIPIIVIDSYDELFA